MCLGLPPSFLISAASELVRAPEITGCLGRLSRLSLANTELLVSPGKWFHETICYVSQHRGRRGRFHSALRTTWVSPRGTERLPGHGRGERVEEEGWNPRKEELERKRLRVGRTRVEGLVRGACSVAWEPQAGQVQETGRGDVSPHTSQMRGPSHRAQGGTDGSGPGRSAFGGQQ